jgi:hypothetical protein
MPHAEILHPYGSFHPDGTRMLFSKRMEASLMLKLRGARRCPNRRLVVFRHCLGWWGRAGEKVDAVVEEVKWRRENREGIVFKGRDAAGARIQSSARERWRRRMTVAVYAASGTGASISVSDLTLCRRLKLHWPLFLSLPRRATWSYPMWHGAPAILLSFKK